MSVVTVTGVTSATAYLSISIYVSSELQRLLLKVGVFKWHLLTSTDASTLTTTRSISRGLLGGAALVAFPASGAITESYTTAISIDESYMSQTDRHDGIVVSKEPEMRKLTALVAAEVTTAVATSPHRGLGGLRLGIALGGAGGGLVDGLDRDDGLLLAVGVVACSVKLGSVSCDLRFLSRRGHFVDRRRG